MYARHETGSGRYFQRPGCGRGRSEAAGKYIAWFSRCAEDNTLFLNTERANRPSDAYWSYFAFTGKALKGRDPATIECWYKAEIAKLRVDSQTRAVLDDTNAGPE